MAATMAGQEGKFNAAQPALRPDPNHRSRQCAKNEPFPSSPVHPSSRNLRKPLANAAGDGE
jgi:hypothetical protein